MQLRVCWLEMEIDIIRLSSWNINNTLYSHDLGLQLYALLVYLLIVLSPRCALLHV